jgi:serine protease Do
VIAVGNPFGLSGSATAGIVSANGRDIGSGPYDDFIQIDAPINKGNSGGPAFNVDGQVVAVNTAIFSPSGGSVGIGFGIPAQTVKAVVAQLKDKGYVSRGWMGVKIQTVTPEIAESLGMKSAQGAIVDEPQTGSPAAKAGIESGDVITAIDGAPVKDARELARKIGSMASGATAKLSVLRKGENKTLSLTLGEMPGDRMAQADAKGAGSDAPRIGLSLAPAKDVAGAGSDGVVITAVEPDSPAAERGFRAGDVILAVGGKAVTNANEVRTALDDARGQGKSNVLMRVKSENATRFVAVPLRKA